MFVIIVLILDCKIVELATETLHETFPKTLFPGLEAVVGSTERVHPTVAALTSTTAEVFTVEPTTTATDTAMAVVITDTLALASSTTTTGARAVSLAAAKGPLPWEQEPDFWAVPWQVWLRCRCIIGIECTKAW